MAAKKDSKRVLRILLAEDGLTPSPGLAPEELVRLSLDAPGMPEALERALEAALSRTARIPENPIHGCTPPEQS